MADRSAAATHPSGEVQRTAAGAVSRLDLLQRAGSSGAAIGVGTLAWPLVDPMDPSKDVLALSSADVDLSPVIEGMGITVVWQGKPILLRHRMAPETKQAREVLSVPWQPI